MLIIVSLVEFVDIATIGLLWISSSAIFSTWTNSMFLQAYHDPLLHTFVRFTGSSIFGFLALRLTGQVRTVSFLQEIRQILLLFIVYNAAFVKFIISVRNVFLPAMFLWLANYANSCALQACGITLTYIVKACIPVLTVAICALRGQRFPLPIFLSLLPICLGVAVASFSDVAFSLQGFLAALLSAVAQAFLNLSIKEVTARTQYSGPVAFMGMSIIW